MNGLFYGAGSPSWLTQTVGAVIAVIAVLISGVMTSSSVDADVHDGLAHPRRSTRSVGVDRSTHGEAAYDLEPFYGVPARPVSSSVADRRP